MVQESLAAAEELAREGLEIEVVDLRTVKPLDTDTVLASVARTGRLLCVGESFPWGGATAEVIARVTTKDFICSMPRPQRLNAKDTPIPYHPNLWSAHRPNAKNIAAKARSVASRIESMPQVPIIMPQLGESIAEATIVDIKVKPGDKVVADQEIIEVETNKAVMGVTTPCKGKIDKITVQLKETYPVGAVLGYIEASEEDAARFAKHAPPPPPAEGSRGRNSCARRSGSRSGARKKDRLRAMATANGPAVCPFQQSQRRRLHVPARARAHG